MLQILQKNYQKEQKLDKFAVVIPVYNEENNIVQLAEELEALDIPFLFVDDGSTDKTATILWMHDFPALCYFPRHPAGAWPFHTPQNCRRSLSGSRPFLLNL